jgi:hypothetical protein
MKKIALYTSLLLTVFIFSAFKVNSLLLTEYIIKSSVLEVKGYVLHKDDNVEAATIKLYQNNRIVKKMTTKKNGKFQFILFSDLEYTIEIEKKSMVTERIQVSTKTKTEFGGKYLYEFRVDLLSANKFKGVDVSNLDYPTALIKYNPEEGEYSHDEEYAVFVKAEMKKLKAEAAALKNR